LSRSPDGAKRNPGLHDQHGNAVPCGNANPGLCAIRAAACKRPPDMQRPAEKAGLSFPALQPCFSSRSKPDVAQDKFLPQRPPAPEPRHDGVASGAMLDDRPIGALPIQPPGRGRAHLDSQRRATGERRLILCDGQRRRNQFSHQSCCERQNATRLLPFPHGSIPIETPLAFAIMAPRRSWHYECDKIMHWTTRS
jgi:hypothetical protein